MDTLDFVGLLAHLKLIGQGSLSWDGDGYTLSWDGGEAPLQGATLHEIGIRLGMALRAVPMTNRTPVDWEPGPVEMSQDLLDGKRVPDGSVLITSSDMRLMYYGPGSDEVLSILDGHFKAWAIVDVDTDGGLIIVGPCDESAYKESGDFVV